MKEKPKNAILDLSFAFAIKVIQYCETLESTRKFVVSNQLLRSATSIGAMINEAQSCESRNDFIHKLKIASKEAEETSFWLKVCDAAPNYPKPENLSNQVKEINKLLSKIISTARYNASLIK